MRRFIAGTRADVASLAVPVRMALWSALVCGLLGGVVGLVVGLTAYPPTAWFAVVELGAPAGLVGGVGGLAFSGLLGVVRGSRRDH